MGELSQLALRAVGSRQEPVPSRASGAPDPGPSSRAQGCVFLGPGTPGAHVITDIRSPREASLAFSSLPLLQISGGRPQVGRCPCERIHQSIPFALKLVTGMRVSLRWLQVVSIQAGRLVPNQRPQQIPDPLGPHEVHMQDPEPARC